MFNKTVKKRVVVADDEPSIRQLIQRVLSQDYVVIEAHDGKEALSLTQTNKPSVVLMDMMMPNMDGLTACHAIKTGKETRNIPVVMLTAINNEGNRKFAKEIWRADEYLTKPFASSELMQILARVTKNVKDIR